MVSKRRSFATKRIAYGVGFPRFLRMESPRISIQRALCTRRCHDALGQRGMADLFVPRSTGRCKVKIVECT
jgi:hypothetical protein